MTMRWAWVAVGVVLVVVSAVVLASARPDGAEDFTEPATLPQGPPLPADTFVFDSDRTGTFELYLQDGDRTVTPLTDDPEYDTWWGRISPDRRTILLQRSPAGQHDRDYRVVSIWAVASDGTSLTQLRPAGTDGWDRQGHPEWSPDGNRITLFGGPSGWNPQVYVADALGQDAAAVTDRPGTNIDPSFAPDGRIVFVGCPHAICTPGSYEVYVTDVDGAEPERLTNDDLRDHDPYVSPDGSTVAWLTQTAEPGAHPVGSWNIRSAPFDGTTRQPDAVGMITDDEHVNSRPVYSLDGQWIYFHRLVYGAEDPSFDVYRIRPDGSEMTSLTEGQPGANEYPGT